MKRFKFFLVTVALLLFASAVPDKTTTIFIIGDSTAANKDISGGKQDNTHYSVYGAHQVARLLADALCEEVPVLKKYRTDADITVDRLGRGQYLSLDDAVAGSRDGCAFWGSHMVTNNRAE